MIPALPLAQHTQISLMDQSSGLQRVAWCFLSQFLGRETAQFVIDKR